MNKAPQKRYDSLYRKHLSALKRQGKAESSIDLYSRAIRRVCEYFDSPPDTLNQEQPEGYFESLISTHSWSTIKVDPNGLQFFYKHVLKRHWQWLDIVKPSQERHLPDALALKGLERLINSTRERRYQTFILTCFRMGLRLGETLGIRMADIDSERGLLYVHQAKGKKDRFALLPKLTLQALRAYWATHRNPTLPFPRGHTPEEQCLARTPMDRGDTEVFQSHCQQRWHSQSDYHPHFASLLRHTPDRHGRQPTGDS
ncbi:tyrosine-type recombinase/integrase [Microbulbifer sp. 2304DJ12-6]|uniref:tyrosine-type recombinase/integrase n=1 Tax=Microbulbifer sp. 2304DJ12-6 TaxID=3233340 RepID=UPI0039AEFC74